MDLDEAQAGLRAAQRRRNLILDRLFGTEDLDEYERANLDREHEAALAIERKWEANVQRTLREMRGIVDGR